MVLEQFLYAIQMGHDGPIKIGIASDPYDRVAKLQTGNPIRLRLLMALPGGNRKLELDMHKRLHAYRMSGEWFQPHPKVLDTLREEEYRPSGIGLPRSSLITQCENCGAVTGDSSIYARSYEPANPLCDPCEEFAALRANGVDPFAEED